MVHYFFSDLGGSKHLDTKLKRRSRLLDTSMLCRRQSWLSLCLAGLVPVGTAAQTKLSRFARWATGAPLTGTEGQGLLVRSEQRPGLWAGPAVASCREFRYEDCAHQHPLVSSSLTCEPSAWTELCARAFLDTWRLRFKTWVKGSKPRQMANCSAFCFPAWLQ